MTEGQVTFWDHADKSLNFRINRYVKCKVKIMLHDNNISIYICTVKKEKKRVIIYSTHDTFYIYATASAQMIQISTLKVKLI
jgi:hypothetical protein